MDQRLGHSSGPHVDDVASHGFAESRAFVREAEGCELVGVEVRARVDRALTVDRKSEKPAPGPGGIKFVPYPPRASNP